MADVPARPLDAQKTRSEMVRRIVEQFDPDRIVLFGSHARGTGGPDSDVDLLIIMASAGSKRKQAAQIDLALAGLGLPKDIIVVTPEEAKTYAETVGTIIRPALREGIVMYGRKACRNARGPAVAGSWCGCHGALTRPERSTQTYNCVLQPVKALHADMAHR